MWTSGTAGVLAILSMAACGTHDDSSQQTAAAGGNVAAVQFAQTGVDFDSDSVRIVGTRSGTANATHCVNQATGCFNFEPGNPIPVPVAGSGAEDFDRLCPTSAANSPPGGTGEWTFTYQIFAEPNCTGDIINSPETDTLVCFAENDLATKSHPNQTVNETIPAGVFVNTILCLAQNTEKKFDFNICTQIPNAADAGSNVTTYNCACTNSGDGGACSCPWFQEQGIDHAPEGCTFDANCNLVCGGVTCPCDSFPLWQTALSGTPITCSSTPALNASLWSIVTNGGAITAGMNALGLPGNTCAVTSIPSGEDDIMPNITDAQLQACFAELEAWQASHGVTCSH
jgi:hypothetical protein